MLEIISARVEQIDADALLLPVDGQLCRLGGAAASALRAALSDDERDDELEYVTDQLAKLRPLAHPSAHVIDGVAKWHKLVVSAAYPHNVDGQIHSASDCARMIRAALPVALQAAADSGARSLAVTLIGTAYRMPLDIAVRAFLDGAAAARSSVVLRWSLPEPDARDLALESARRLGLVR